MKKIISLFLFFGLFSVACTDLDTMLYDRIPEDVYTADPVLRMSPIYAPMRDFIDWGGWWFAQEIPGDAVVAPVRGMDWLDGGKWMVLHRHTWDNNTEAINSMWSRFYRGIVEANKFIETFQPQAGNPIIDQAIAKARIMRAYYYYKLIDNYGDVPYVTQFLNAEERPFRRRRANIWTDIVREIEQSIPQLDNSTSKTAVTRGMAFSLLTKLYLNAQVYTGVAQWGRAEAYADSVIALGAYRLESNPMAPFATNNENSPELIWVIPYHEDDYTGFNLHMRTLHYNSNRTFDMPVGPWNGFAVTQQHFNTYADIDLRKAGYFLVGQQFDINGAPINDVGAGGLPLIFNPFIPALEMTPGAFTAQQIRMSGARVRKFEIARGAKADLSNDFPIFRYADILLMKAEAQLRQGRPVNVPGLDAIRTRAGLPAGWSATLVGQAGLNEILAERGRELFWEGHRRQDLIRFGRFNDAWWEKPASSADRNTFPVPLWAVESNPNLAGNIVN
jgi:hypothetical protein